MIRKFILPILFALVTSAVFSQVTFEISPRKVAINRNLMFKVVVEGGNKNAPIFTQGARDKNFKLMSQSPNTSFSTSIMNGRVSSKREYTYYFKPLREGTFTFAKKNLTIDGNVYSSPPVQVQVVGEETQVQGNRSNRRSSSVFDSFFNRSPGNRQRSNRDPELFAECFVPKKTFYTGEAIQVDVRLVFYGVEIHPQRSRMDWPQMTDFWIEEGAPPNQPAIRVERNGKYYNSSLVGKRTLYANKTGKITIDPVIFELLVSTGGFMADWQNIRRETKPVTLNILPLPTEGKPNNFKDAVGEFQLKAELDKTSLAVGETLSLKIILSGSGNFSTIQNLGIEGLKEHFDVFDGGAPQAEENKGLIVKKTWGYALVPKHEGQFEIPSIPFSFFDLSDKTYKTLNTKSFTIEVLPGSRLPEQLNRGSENDTPRQALKDQSLRFIKFEENGWENVAREHASPKWLYFLTAFVIIGNLLFLMMIRVRNSWLDKQAGMRPRMAFKIFQQNIKKLKKKKLESNQDFFSELSNVLMAYFGAKLERPAQGLLLDEIERVLEKDGADPELFLDLVSCVESCDFARFTSSSTTSREKLIGQVTQVVTRSEEVLK